MDAGKSAVTFRVLNILMILVAFDAHAARGFNAPKIIKLGSVEQKLSRKNLGVVF